MKTAVVVTGATGFLGSHLALQLLEQLRDHVVICVARGKGTASATERVFNALRTAHSDCGTAGSPDEHFGRVRVIEDNLFSSTDQSSNAAFTGESDVSVASFWHCAASIQFTDSQHSSVWQTNVTGLKNALRLAAQMGAQVFNHVSTAYVAGTLCGRIPETVDLKPDAFNNVYEASKHHGEQLVRQECESCGMSYRIVRPSIIIGHSQTFRTSSDAGFYQWLDALKQLHEKVMAKDAAYFDCSPLRVRVDRNATLNLIPVDIVVAEMLALEERNTHTLNQVFHITSESPVSLHDVLHTIASFIGIRKVEIAGSQTELRAIDKLFNKQVKMFTPYLTQRKMFDRSNIARHGIDHYQINYLLDAERVKNFALAYLALSETAIKAAALTRQERSAEESLTVQEAAA